MCLYVLPVGGAGDGYVFVVVDPAGDPKPRQERDDGAAAEEHWVAIQYENALARVLARKMMA